VEQPTLVVTERDLPGDVRNLLIAERDETRLLGGRASTAQALFDAIPSVIARRLERIVPDNFTLEEIELKLLLDVEIPGFKCGGDITVKLRPHSHANNE
jgi:hypothetical protein